MEKIIPDYLQNLSRHDPLVRQLYLPSLKEAGDELVRLDLEPKQSLRNLFS